MTEWKDKEMCRIQLLLLARIAMAQASLCVSLLFTSVAAADSASSGATADAPHLSDPRYTISLFAASPGIRTPIGAAVDTDDRLFVIESHTLAPPPDYDGPKTDRILVFVDDDQDGKPNGMTVFAEDLKSAMNLAPAPDGAIYVTCSRSVLRLKDTNGDSRADQRGTILQFNTEDTFPFGYLTTTVFAPDGWLYVSFGEFPFAWKLSGTDGTTIEGWGGGDGVFRCRPDGTHLQRVATGFWAPFAMTLDEEGRLLLIDNDPFSRGPNRLIHVVTAGDYGHRWLYGFSGSHPLNGWNGDLPGTLPPVSEVGEAPTGLIACATGRFPPDYAASLLVSAWGGNAIERHEMAWRDTRAEDKRSVWIQGGSQFHPIALAQNSRGVLYITDWVENNFHSHGNGRIWQVSPRKGVNLVRPKPPTQMWQSHQPQTKEEIRTALRSSEPVERHAGNIVLSQPHFAELAAELAEATDPRLRLGALTAIRRSTRADGIDFCRRFLNDENESVRHAAVVWAGQERFIELGADLQRSFTSGVPSARLLDALLGATSVLKPEFVELCQTVKNPSTMEALPTTLPNSLTHPLLRNAIWSTELRARVLPWIEDASEKETSLLLLDLARSEEMPLNIESMRRLTESKHSIVDEQLVDVALDANQSIQIRCEAVATLARRGSGSADLLPLLSEGNESLAIEVIEAVRGLLNQPTVSRALQRIVDAEPSGRHSRVQSEASFVLQSHEEVRPTDLASWQQMLAIGGDASRGARRFFSQRTTCVSCHTIRGFGGAVGPDLSNVAQSLDRALIIRSLVRPSAYFGPEFQLYALATNDGRVYSGMLLSTDDDGITLLLDDGKKLVIRAADIDSLQPQRKSIMPDRLEATLSVEGLRDLVAFLSTLK